jgi:CRP/FNR family cyclic AMP-dependent transcriptional regulator
MTRATCTAAIVALAVLAWMLVYTDGQTAITFSFLGHGSLALALGLYAYATWGPVRMSKEEAALYRLVFSSLRRRDFARIAAFGNWEDFSLGDALIRKGESPDRIWVLLRGRVRYEVDGQEIGSVGPGEIVGASVAFADAVAWGDAIASEPVRCLEWTTGTLETQLENRVEVRAALQAIISQDLAHKIQQLARR